MYLYIFISLSILVSIMLCEKTTKERSLALSPCHVGNDPIYMNGTIVDCQHQGISSLPLPQHWIPSETTSLLLDFNFITNLTIDSFSNLRCTKSLRVLRLSNNKISSIGKNVFSSFISLQRLDLNFNPLNLDQKWLNGQVFQGLSNLVELALDNNGLGQTTGAYNDSLFNELHNLTTLSLDTFSGDLQFGSLFHNTRKLSSLTLTGGVEFITNASFESFVSIKLTTLKLIDVRHLLKTETGAFLYLQYLDWLEIKHCKQELNVTLESLAPFENKNMSYLILNHPSYWYNQGTAFLRNSVLTRHMARYLSNICLEHFTLTDGRLFIIETGVLTSTVWRRCLKSLDIYDNPIIGESLELLRITSLHNLENFAFGGRKYWMSNYKHYIWKPPVCTAIINTLPLLTKNIDKGKLYKMNRPQLEHSTNIHTNVTNLIQNNIMNNTRMKAVYTFKKYSSELNEKKNTPKAAASIYLPRYLRTILLSSISNNYGSLEHSIKFINGERLEELHLCDNGFRDFTGNFSGLINLKLVDVSKNDGSVMSPTFFDSMSSIVSLNMAKMKLDVKFMADHSKRLFSNLHDLITLDLSDNGLRALSKDTFATNNKLSVLSLKGNRFESIPFNLLHVPNLCHLDMRENSLNILSDKDTMSLESHFEIRKSFSLSLNGNEFDCGCNSIRFLSWLQRTQINLDNDRNYSCNLDFSHRTTTSQMKDLDALWRKCNGEKSFWISFGIILCLMIPGYMSCILIPKVKTQLKASFLKTFWNPFIMKTSADYPIGVYIGYADNDIPLACTRIRPYIETKLNLSTYVRHRDLLPASDIAESIMEAVNSSWRVLLVVSPHFLQDDWSFYVRKAATYAVQAENPGRIVLILLTENEDDSLLLSRIEDDILRVVQEENIIYMAPNGNISYEDKQALKTALL